MLKRLGPSLTVPGETVTAGCQPGFFKAEASNRSCEACPANSQALVSGAQFCFCKDGFYRAPTDLRTGPCTGENPTCIELLFSAFACWISFSRINTLNTDSLNTSLCSSGIILFSNLLYYRPPLCSPRPHGLHPAPVRETAPLLEAA